MKDRDGRPMPSDAYYKTPEWHRLRTAALMRDHYRCCVRGCFTVATHVDHVLSRRDGGPDRLDNLRCFCAVHDNQVKEDATGKRRSDGSPYVVGCDVSGRPLDPGHWWNQQSKKISQS